MIKTVFPAQCAPMTARWALVRKASVDWSAMLEADLFAWEAFPKRAF